jgi:phosphate starvation-inducible membrane PsiE
MGNYDIIEALIWVLVFVYFGGLVVSYLKHKRK